ncbi:hypothetical protein Q361_1302 [Flavobacterium croceum DSM 17960]|uniref:Uncharacterized protein n=2 Tax=Flavobacterium TaxID=237 RepID=A0A2S4N4M4_9FLAO|nr:hypothetical protein Q361_1302 [Flavobacterium croceum DSM 17960]
MKQNVKYLAFIFFIIFQNAFSQENSECKFFEAYDEPALACLDKNENKENTIYQIIEWTAFGDDYITRIEKKNNTYKLIRKLAPKPKYIEQTDSFKSEFKYITNRKLTKKEFNKFIKIYEKYNLNNIEKIEITIDCFDGSGILFYIFENGKYKFLRNGNCQESNETLNNFSNEVNVLFKF